MIIETTFLNRITEKRDYLCSVSVYAMMNEFSLHEISFFEYLIYEFIGDVPDNVNVRIYVDNYSQYLFHVFKYVTFIEFVKCICPAFYIKGTDRHQGYFGHLLKFLPLFYFPEDYNVVWISDLTKSSSLHQNKKTLERFKNSKAVFLIESSIFNYPTKTSFVDTNLKLVKSVSIYVTKIQIPEEYLTGFLGNLLAGKYSNELNKFYLDNTWAYPNHDPKEILGLFPFETTVLMLENVRSYLVSLRKWFINQIYVDLTPMFKSLYRTKPETKEILEPFLQKIRHFAERFDKLKIFKQQSSDPTFFKEKAKLTNTICSKLRKLDIPNVNYYCDKFKRASMKLEDIPSVQYRYSTNILNKKIDTSTRRNKSYITKTKKHIL